MRRTVLPAAAVVFALAGCSKSTPSVNTTPMANAPTTNTAAAGSTAAAPAKASATSATSAAPKQAKVGDTIDLASNNEHVQITLVKIVDPAKSTDEFRTPAEGKRFVAVQVRILNVDSKAYTADPMARTVAKDADGEVFDADFSPAETAVGHPMNSGLTLAPGEKGLGVMTFEVSSSVKLTSMQYSTHGFGGGNVAQWTLS